MASVKQYFSEGSRIFFSSWKRRIISNKYRGKAVDICNKIVHDCWNGRFFQTSTSNFTQFWTRDFGWCVNSLLKLDYGKEVHQTLRYALNRFKEAEKITTTITPKGEPFDFPKQSIDSLPWLIHAIRLSKFPFAVYTDLLNIEIKKFQEEFIDDTGLVKEGHFSSMKDFAIRKSSCYDNSMVGMLAADLAKINSRKKKLENPFEKYDYGKLIVDNFWNGEYFFDDLQKKEYVAGDANLFPFVCGLVEDNNLLKKAINSMEEAKLAEPFPLKYTASRKYVDFISEEFFLRDYESSAVWMHMGPLYVKLLRKVDPEKANKYKKKYTGLIEMHHNFLEVFDSNGKPFSTPFYYCDDGMLWAANYLTL